MAHPLQKDPLYVRNVVFGVEDSLVSTVGLLSGIATEHASHAAILSTGVIYIFVEAFSMAVGSFLSEESVQELEGKTGGFGRAALGAGIMFVSFTVAGFLPIIPYLLSSGTTALAASIIVALVFLFVLGYVAERPTKTQRTVRALRMAAIGGFAIVVGVMVGAIFGVS